MTDRDREAMCNIAANVRRYREAVGLSMSALARQIGDYPGTIKRIEDGDNMPGAGLLLRIADALNVTPNELYAAVPASTRKKLARAS